MFEFIVVCRTYDYASNDQKLKSFPSIVKDVALCWFMSLPGGNIATWAQMQEAFNDKYEDYGRSKETKDKIFRMTLGPVDSLEDYEQRFQLNYRSANCTLNPKSLKLVLIRGIREEVMETLEILSPGDAYQLTYDDIKIVF